MNHEQILRLCPRSPGQGYDWADCCEVFPRLLALEHTPQNPRYHAEGNVGIHTRMVLDALLASAYFQAAGAERREVLFLAALLHDLCKPETTVIDPVTGEIGQPGHSRRGAVDVRVLLWRAALAAERAQDPQRALALWSNLVSTAEGAERCAALRELYGLATRAQMPAQLTAAAEQLLTCPIPAAERGAAARRPESAAS